MKTFILLSSVGALALMAATANARTPSASVPTITPTTGPLVVKRLAGAATVAATAGDDGSSEGVESEGSSGGESEGSSGGGEGGGSGGGEGGSGGGEGGGSGGSDD